MKYTRSQVRDMSPMEYWEAMCQELKKAGFQGQRGNRPPHDYEPFDAVFGGDIVFNLDAVHYLQNMGLLDNGKCPMCGIREDAVNYALSYHKQEKTVRSKGGITAMFSEVIKGLLEYRSARVVQQSNSFIGISGFFYDPITSRECGNWGFKLQISFKLLVVQYRAYVDLGGGEHIKQNWDFPITLSQSEIVNILKKKADETNVYGIFK